MLSHIRSSFCCNINVQNVNESNTKSLTSDEHNCNTELLVKCFLKFTAKY